MKTCPVCKARCFDDMEICYGCMYRFNGSEGRGDPAGGELPLPRGLSPAPRRAPERAVAADGVYVPTPSRTEAPLRMPHVFGALDDAPAASPEASESPSPHHEEESHRSSAHDESSDAAPEEPPSASPLQKLPSPLVTASLGNGYRLVISLEPE